MDQPRKIAKPTRGQLNGELSVLTDASVVSSYYICIAVCICLYTYGVYFLFGDMHIRARFTAVQCAYIYMCVATTAVCMCMYICMVIRYSKGKDQPGKVANPARGQLAEQGK